VTPHPETRHGGNRKSKRQDVVLKSFTADTAGKTGVAQRTVERDVALARNLDEATRDAIRDTPIANNKKELTALGKLTQQASDACLRA
jgi:hypothetical protein